MSDKKKIYTREEFEELRNQSAVEMASDTQLHRDAIDVLVRADHYRWIHQTNWLGEPILNLPQDMFALQDIIFKTRPKFIIEVGVAWGGSLLFCSTLMEILGGVSVIGIDIYIPEDLKERIMSHGKISERIKLINGSSNDESTLSAVRSIVGNERNILVILDSYHTHEHVLQELRNYSPFAGKGNYIICGDTIVEDIPEQVHRTRPWGPGNNPATAVKEFLSESDRFVVDEKIEQRLLFSCNPGGYLKAVK